MIEIAFGDSAAGSLKQAKKMKQGKTYSSVHVIYEGIKKKGRKEKKTEIWTGIDLEGNSSDVEVLFMALDIGDISDMDSDMLERKGVLNSLYGDYSGAPDDIWDASKRALSRIDEAKTSLEPIRMWVCEGDPSELCSFYFICRYMDRTETPLSVVIIPDHLERNNCIVNYRSTGEIAPEVFGELLKYEKPLNDLIRGVYAGLWNIFMQENSPLRAIVNGKLMGVPEDFYDFSLRANMPDGEFISARLIGKTLNAISGIGDRWLYIRLLDMIKAGELIEVSPAAMDHPYSAVLKKSV